MKIVSYRVLFSLLLLAAFAPALRAQSTNFLSVSQFAGTDVGSKLTKAQAACVSGLPCVLQLGPELSSFPAGTLPTRCASCIWIDYRTAGAFNVAGSFSPQTVLGYVDITQYASGLGTCASPWTSPSGTGGLSEAQAANTGGFILFARPGVYAITTAYTPPDNTRIWGAGWSTSNGSNTSPFGSTNWTCGNGRVNGTVFLVIGTNDAFTLGGGSGVQLYNFAIVGPGSGVSNGFSLSTTPQTGTTIDQVLVGNFNVGYNFTGWTSGQLGSLYAFGDSTCIKITNVFEMTIKRRDQEGCGTATIFGGGAGNNVVGVNTLSGLVQSNTNGDLYQPGAGASIVSVYNYGIWHENNTNFAIKFDSSGGTSIQHIGYFNSRTAGTGGTADEILFNGANTFAAFAFVRDDFRGSDISVPAALTGFSIIDTQFKTYANAGTNVTRMNGDASGVQSTAFALTNLVESSTAPTIAGAGCGGSSASISANNGTASFNINVGTAPTSGGCTVTMPAAAAGWNCSVTDITTNSTSVFYQKQTGGSTTSVVVNNFSDVAVATAPNANDIYRMQCSAF